MPVRLNVVRGETTRSAVVRRSVVLHGRKTSVSLEDEFWGLLKEIAVARNTTVSYLITTVDCGRRQVNLSSTLRLYVLRWLQQRVRESASEQLMNIEAALGQAVTKPQPASATTARSYKATA